MSLEKTKGQILYELLHPGYLRVVLFENHHFATYDDSFLVENKTYLPWYAISETSKQNYELQAKTHHLTCGGGE